MSDCPWYAPLCHAGNATALPTAEAIAERDRALTRRAAGDDDAIGTPSRPFLSDAQIAQRVAAGESVPDYIDDCGAFDIACKVGRVTDGLGRVIGRGVLFVGLGAILYVGIKYLR